MNAENKPLSGYRVVELSTFVAAPSCGKILADWGADVIKVDSPSGDVFRHYGQVMNMPASEEENPVWDMLNGNKRGMAIDLKTSDGTTLFHKLLETADVFLTNIRPTALKKIGLDYESLKEKYPRLVHALISGFGKTDLMQIFLDLMWRHTGHAVGFSSTSLNRASTRSIPRRPLGI